VSTIFEHQGPWRFDELAALPEDGHRYEVVDGALVVSPPPGQHHQLVGAELFRQLAVQCPQEWRVVYEWPLPMGTDGRVADLAVVRRAVAVRGAGQPYPLGPEHVGLVVEVVSPSSRKTDRFAKPGEYAEAGIPLFWRVETEPGVAVHVHRRTDDGYLLTSCLDGVGQADAPWGSVEVDLRSLG
jgi:Uma2 family endonuclease